MISSMVRFADYGAGAILMAAALAGCGGSSPSIGAPEATSALSARRAAAALTMPHFVQGPARPDRNRSWMSPDAKKSKVLVYVGDWDTNDVYVYDYASGTQVGVITGNDEPYGMCVDAKGDIYVANFGNGEVNEYPHGGTTPIITYSPGGELIGCSVDAKGDVSATSFNPGEVTVFPKGKTTAGTTYSDSSCEYLWTMGSDNKGDLVGIGEYDSIQVCALLAGSKSMTTLTTKGITINFPGGTTWDGKYFALGDQEYQGMFGTAVIQATLKGTTLKYEGHTLLSGGCKTDTDDVNPFIFGKTNVPGSTKQGSVAAGTDVCDAAGSSYASAAAFWHYPKGGLPFKYLGSGSKPPVEPYGVGVSVAQ